MKITLISAGKTRVPFISEGLKFYGTKINNYFQWEIIETQDLKGISDIKRMTESEGEKIIKHIQEKDTVILLDEKGNLYNSIEFSENLEKIIQNSSVKKIVFVIAGAYGASEQLKKRANYIWSLSPLTFPHQLVRLILVEQIYRALTIMKKEPYHHI
ncbi:MAG: 23S rRNA (pseudouridine(1915)-N(3))-methyltransferase RlmH [Bacteroidales bacterium]|nr:23S rRNA (pseudouridine(1915)-N(3))-methyltransferase RlmH [Bacteroidales bacterium]